MRILAVLALASAPVSAQCLVAQLPPADAVALDHDTLATADLGVVRIYEAQGGLWNQTAQIQGDVDCGFGYRIALSRIHTHETIPPYAYIPIDTLAVSAPWDDDLGTDAGAVYLFQKIGADWPQISKLYAPDTEAGDNFGYRLGMDQWMLAVSSPGDDARSVNWYQTIGDTWTHFNKYVGPPGATGFGSELAVGGQAVAVLADDAGYVPAIGYEFTPPTPGPYENIDMEGNMLVMGSPSAGTTIFVGTDKLQTIGYGVTVAIGGPGLLVGAADGLHVYGPVLDYDIYGLGHLTGFTETALLPDTGALTARGDRFALSDAESVRLYSFDLSECHGPKLARGAMPAGKHP